MASIGSRTGGWMLAATLAAGSVAFASAAWAAGPADKINHVIVIYQENWSFDSLYGKFPGADGIGDALSIAAQSPKNNTVAQVDKTGVPYAVLPQPLDTSKSPAVPDPRFPANLPVAPFDASLYVPADQKTGDLVHRFYQEQYQIDGGKMDKFVSWSNAAGLVMSYYDATNMPEGKLAQQYTICDNFFHAAFGGSFLNHQFLIAAAAPTWPNAPADIVAQLDANGVMTKDGQVTPDGYAINTSFTVNTPHPSTTAADHLVPLQTQPTIGDRLSEKDITWAWYSGGWNDALAGKAEPLFQFHHQPFAFYANYKDGTQAKADHLKDEKDFLQALTTANTLSAVSFIKPLGPDNEHPGYASLTQGQQHVADLVSAVQNSPYWADTAIIITYDENGGRWDHVSPPKGDRWGPGTRVPAIIISPFAKKGYVDHTQYDTTSILKFIETRWGLSPLSSHDAAANDLLNAFQF